jgi:hypothetical protein
MIMGLGLIMPTGENGIIQRNVTLSPPNISNGLDRRWKLSFSITVSKTELRVNYMCSVNSQMTSDIIVFRTSKLFRSFVPS